MSKLNVPDNTSSDDGLITRARACTICKDLPLGPRPLFQVSKAAKVLIVGQAPGSKTHEKGIPFNDPSGDRLRDWMGVSKSVFYDATKVAILPMGFCFPGTGRTGDLPPRPECAENWRQEFMDLMTCVKLTIIIGKYARDWHLPERAGETVTATVADWQALAPYVIPLPHPSPRNNRWLKKNPWFEKEVLPILKDHVTHLVSS